MNNKNIYNLTIKKIKDLKVNPQRLLENSEIFIDKTRLFSFSHCLHDWRYQDDFCYTDSSWDGYLSFFIRLSTDKIESISFSSNYDTTDYTFDSFAINKEMSEGALLIRNKFLDFINSLIYLGVLYGEREDLKLLKTE